MDNHRLSLAGLTEPREVFRQGGLSLKELLEGSTTSGLPELTASNLPRASVDALSRASTCPKWVFP